MNDEQRAAFAKNGYIVVKDVLTSEELDELNAVWDAHVRGRTLDANRFSQTITDDHGNKYAGRRFWSAAYRSLIDHPKIYPILQEMLTDPRWGHAPPGLPLEYRGRIRLDHDNIVHLPAYDPEQMETHGWGAKTLHGNPQNWHVTTVFELKSIGKDEGGFGAAAGTHKREGQTRLLNMGLATEEWRTQWCDNAIAGTPQHPNWSKDVPIHKCEGQAGDCLIFSEKMTHGTLPWCGSDERRTLFYKYTCWGLHHADVGYDVTDPLLTEQQRSIVAFSSHWFNNPTQPNRQDYLDNAALTRLHPDARSYDPFGVPGLEPGFCAPNCNIDANGEEGLITKAAAKM